MPPKKTKLKAPTPKVGGSWDDLDTTEEQDDADADKFLALFNVKVGSTRAIRSEYARPGRGGMMHDTPTTRHHRDPLDKHHHRRNVHVQTRCGRKWQSVGE